MKGLPYKTVWVEYVDIIDTCKKIGADSERWCIMYTAKYVKDDEMESVPIEVSFVESVS